MTVPGLDVEAFPAAAGILDIGVVEFKAFVESFARIVEFGAIDIHQTFRIDEYSDTMAFKSSIAFGAGVGKLQNIGKTGAARRPHGNA